MRVYIIKIRSKLKVERSTLRLRHQVQPMLWLKKDPLLFRVKKNTRSSIRN